MKTKQILSCMTAAMMVASAGATAALAETYQWGSIIGLNDEQATWWGVVDGDGNSIYRDGKYELRPDTKYYSILGTSDIYQNYMSYEKLVKINVNTVSGGKNLVPGSVKLVERYFDDLEGTTATSGGTGRFTAIEFKTVDDLTDSEQFLFFTVELSARKDLSLAIGANRFPAVTGEADDAAAKDPDNSANTAAIADLNALYRSAQNVEAAAKTAASAYNKLKTDLNKIKSGFATDANMAALSLNRDYADVNNAGVFADWTDGEKASGNTVVQTYRKAAATFYNTLSPVAAKLDQQIANDVNPFADAVTVLAKLDIANADDALSANDTNAVITNLYVNSTLLSDSTPLSAAKTSINNAIAANNGTNYAAGATYLNQGDKLQIPVKIWFKNEVIDGPDATFTVGDTKQFYSVSSNDWNEITWENGNGTEIAKFYFYADSSGDGFYTALKTNWSNEWYRKYFAHTDAYKFDFAGQPNVSTTHRATLSLYMPFVDELGYTKAGFDPTKVYIYRINEEDQTIEDMTEYFSYGTDTNGNGWYVADTRVVSTYVISEKAANLPAENEQEIVVVPSNNGKVPANTGRLA